MSFAKVVVIAGTLLVILVFAGSFMEKADAVLTKAQAFQPKFLTDAVKLFEKYGSL